MAHAKCYKDAVFNKIGLGIKGMEVPAKIGIVGAVLFFICLVGFIGFALLALPPLMERDYTTFTNAVYYILGFGVVAFLGFMVWMVGVILALTKEK